MEEANGLVRWPEEAPGLGQGEGGLQGLPLVELPRKNSGEDAGPDAEAAAVEAGRHAPDVGALQREGGGQAALPRFG